jgi:hypothetical protein
MAQRTYKRKTSKRTGGTKLKKSPPKSVKVSRNAKDTKKTLAAHSKMVREKELNRLMHEGRDIFDYQRNPFRDMPEYHRNSQT